MNEGAAAMVPGLWLDQELQVLIVNGRRSDPPAVFHTMIAGRCHGGRGYFLQFASE